MNSRVAFYGGSFNPFTEGHRVCLCHALTMYDKVIVGVGVNQDKKAFLSAEQCVLLIKASLSDFVDMFKHRDLIGKDFSLVETLAAERLMSQPECVKVIAYSGLTVDAAIANDAGVLVRGERLRATLFPGRKDALRFRLWRRRPFRRRARSRSLRCVRRQDARRMRRVCREKPRVLRREVRPLRVRRGGRRRKGRTECRGKSPTRRRCLRPMRAEAPRMRGGRRVPLPNQCRLRQAAEGKRFQFSLAFEEFLEDAGSRVEERLLSRVALLKKQSAGDRCVLGGEFVLLETFYPRNERADAHDSAEDASGKRGDVGKAGAAACKHHSAADAVKNAVSVEFFADNGEKLPDARVHNRVEGAHGYGGSITGRER